MRTLLNSNRMACLVRQSRLKQDFWAVVSICPLTAQNRSCKLESKAEENVWRNQLWPLQECHADCWTGRDRQSSFVRHRRAGFLRSWLWHLWKDIETLCNPCFLLLKGNTIISAAITNPLHQPSWKHLSHPWGKAEDAVCKPMFKNQGWVG